MVLHDRERLAADEGARVEMGAYGVYEFHGQIEDDAWACHGAHHGLLREATNAGVRRWYLSRSNVSKLSVGGRASRFRSKFGTDKRLYTRWAVNMHWL